MNFEALQSDSNAFLLLYRLFFLYPEIFKLYLSADPQVIVQRKHMHE